MRVLRQGDLDAIVAIYAFASKEPRREYYVRKIAGILKAGIHSKPAQGVVQMGGVAREQDPSRAKGLRDTLMDPVDGAVLGFVGFFTGNEGL
jgi:hypothetical protein